MASIGDKGLNGDPATTILATMIHRLDGAAAVN